MNNIPISAGGPIKDSIGRGKRIAKKVVKTIEKPNYKSMIKEKKISIAKSLDNIIKKCEKTAIKPIKKQFTTPSGKIPKYDPITHPHVEEKLGMKGGFHSHVGEKMHQISTPHLPKLSKAPEPITKRNLGRAGSMLNPFLERATESKKIYDPKLPPISPYTLPKSSYRNWGKTKQEYDKHLTKSSELQKAEDLIFLKADRLGHILSKDYEKVDDLTLVKGFGCIEKIPETMRKSSDTICKEFGLDKAYSIDAIDKELDSRK